MHAEVTGHVGECQSTWSHEHIHKHSSRTLPSQCCSPMKYLGFWMALIPYCPPQQVHCPYVISGCPPLPARCRKGKIKLQTGGGSVPTLWAGGRIQVSQYSPHRRGNFCSQETESRIRRGIGRCLLQAPEGPRERKGVWGDEQSCLLFSTYYLLC